MATNGIGDEIGWWCPTLDATGYGTSTLYDLSGNSHNMSMSCGWETSGSYKAATFASASSQSGSVAINLSGVSTLTASIWWYWNAFANDNKLLMEYTTNYTITNGGFIINPNAASTSAMAVNQKRPTVNGGTMTRPSATTWANLICEYKTGASGTGWVSVWMNNSLVSFSSTNTGDSTGAFANSSLYLFSRESSSLFADGKFDDLRLFNRSLTSGERASLQTRGYTSARESVQLYLVG